MTHRTELPIRRLSVRRARFPLDTPFRAAVVRVDAVHLAILELDTDGGPGGVAYGFGFSDADSAMIASAIAALRDVVIGQDAMKTEALWRRMQDALAFAGLGGPALAALSVIDIAAWDARAQSIGLPLDRMLGAAREDIPAYASGGSLAGTPGELAAEMEAYAAAGHVEMKLKLGASSQDNVERIAAVRDAVGPDAVIYADGNQQWAPAEAARMAAALERFDLGWLEEPLPADEIADLANLRSRLSVALATGETNFGLDAFRRLIHRRAADVLMPNLQRVGGITGWMRIAQAAALTGISMATHVNTHFMLPLICAAPTGRTFEHVPWWPNPFNEPLDLSGGRARPSPAPGLGVTLNEARLRHSPV